MEKTYHIYKQIGNSWEYIGYTKAENPAAALASFRAQSITVKPTDTLKAIGENK